jgi:hypothetical protein
MVSVTGVFQWIGQVGISYNKCHCSLAGGLFLLSGPSWIPNGCEGTEEKTAESKGHRYKMEAGMPSFNLVFG